MFSNETQIRTVIFDADGVIVNPAFGFAKHLDEKLSITREMTQPFFKKEFHACMKGERDIKKVLKPYLKDWKFKGTVDDFLLLWLQKEDLVDQEIIKLIRKIKQKGFQLCLATNQEKNRARYMKNVMGFKEIFDRLFFSCEIGYEKPEKEYYKHIEKKISKKPEEILFIDDSRKFIEGAKKNNWNTILFKNISNLNIKLKERNIL